MWRNDFIAAVKLVKFFMARKGKVIRPASRGGKTSRGGAIM
jgi:hypothetical protein